MQPRQTICVYQFEQLQITCSVVEHAGHDGYALQVLSLCYFCVSDLLIYMYA